MLRYCVLALLFLSSLCASSPACDETLDVVPFLAEPFRDLQDVGQRLTCLQQHFVAGDDCNGIFLGVYLEVTKEMIEKIQEGFFHDNEWTGIYLVNFADIYRQRVVSLYTNPDELPAPWKMAFCTGDASQNPLIVQDLVLGMNAHIDYDLAFAIEKSGVTPHFFAKHRDHTLVNEVLKEAYVAALATLADRYNPILANFSIAVGRLDEILFEVALFVSREAAWDSAVALSAAHLALTRRMIAKGLEMGSSMVAHLVLAAKLDRVVYEALQVFEGDDKLATFCDWMPQCCCLDS